MQDAYGNYQAGLEPGPSLPSAIGVLWTGNGAPSDSLGNNGDTYVDQLTGDIYSKSGGTWSIAVGDGGGTIQVFQDRAPSTPPDDPTKPAVSFPTGGGDLSQWDVNSQAWV